MEKQKSGDEKLQLQLFLKENNIVEENIKFKMEVENKKINLFDL